MKVIIFNAPPEGGKDIAAKRCRTVFGCDHLEFKDQIFKLVKTVYGIDENTWKVMYQRQNKEKVFEELHNRTPRQAMIHMSESVIKPAFGWGYFGEATARQIKKDTVFSDGGFIEELQPIIEKVGIENVMIVRIHRDGFTFEGDSRSYLPNIPNLKTVDIMNHMPKDDNQEEYEDFLNRIETLCKHFLGGDEK